MKFATAYERESSKKEKLDQTIKVQKIGYVPAKKRIEDIINAGMRLKDFRASQYDFPEGTEIDETLNDPTRAKNFDLADASQLKYAAEASLKASQAALKASQEVSKEPPDPSTVKIVEHHDDDK